MEIADVLLYNQEKGSGKMIILIAGASHTGKTVLSQQLLEEHHYPYLSIDHLKMGLIRSGQTDLTPNDDEKLSGYLWPIVREIIKTAIENGQNLIVEGCYIPFDWSDSFEENYLNEIRYVCLIMSSAYIDSNFDSIRNLANEVEHRLDDRGLTKEWLISQNTENLLQCKQYKCPYVLIEDNYNVFEQVGGILWPTQDFT